MQKFTFRHDGKEIEVKLNPPTFAIANKYVAIKQEQQKEYSELDRRYSYINELAPNSQEWILESSKKYDEFLKLEWKYAIKYFACLPVLTDFVRVGLKEEYLEIDSEFWNEQDLTAVEEAVKFFREKTRV